MTPARSTESVVVVTGAATLIGAAVVRRLRNADFADVVADAERGLELTDRSAVRELFADVRPQYVVHAGGRSGGIGANVRLPAELMHDNLLAATHVVEAAHDCDVQKLLYLASSCCYPRHCSQPMREADLWSGPLEPTNAAYAAAKLAGAALCQAYRRQYGCDFVVGVPANAFGPGDDFSPDDSHVIAALLRRMHEAKLRGDAEVTIWGTGAARREFIFADDLADACLFVLRNYSDVEPINLGGGGDVSIRELAEMIRDVVGYPGALTFDATKPDGMPRKSLDGAKLAALGWRPSHELGDALRRTYAGYLAHTAVAPTSA